MKTTEKFTNALNEALLAKNWTYSDLAKASGMSLETARRYKNGLGTHISDANVRLVCLSLGINPDEFLTAHKPHIQPVQPVRQNELAEVPVLGFACAAGWEPAIESFNDFVAGAADEYVRFSDVRENYFALRVEGQSMAPAFPNGTKLLVAGGDFPERGDLVVAKLSDQGGIIIVKRYLRKDGIVRLESENKSGKNFEIHLKEEQGRIIWMYPVIKAEIDLRARRNWK